METNRDLEAAWHYHERTKHSFQSVHSSQHLLDFQNQPLPFKIYPSLEPIPLPRGLEPYGVPALEALAASAVEPKGDRLPDLGLLGPLLHYSAGITTRIRSPRGEMLFRAASCTGALYHIDLYLACGDLSDLEAGVYHFGVHDFSLRRLRRGDFRGELVRATADEPAVALAPVILICSSTFWRNSWKYQARAYRHCFWDSGTILANLLAITTAQRVAARVVCGFVDDRVNRLLGLEPQQEVALALVPLGRNGPIGQAPEVRPLALETTALSRSEVGYPAIRAMHEASSLTEEAEVAAWRGAAAVAQPAPSSGRLYPLRSLSEEEAPQGSIEEVILRRGSSRRFARQTISLEQLSTALSSIGGIAADFTQSGGRLLNDAYIIVNDVEGLPCGCYVYHPDESALELLREGEFRDEAGDLGLEQGLPADASANVFFLTDLAPILERFGNRGYRLAQLEAAINGGRLYLASYALGLGATGLTFYDDGVTDFFSPHAEGKSAMFLVALGHPFRRSLG
ncbi:MAG TPA: SagB/ThcOx family dehydrogenase [Chloroflexota bacterium]